ncbi:DUF3313 domain-containing protein [Pseudomonas sp. PDM18]|uniref:DUF3313 domain-containing protein n=1 Tax=unclassified Pseudomonas TaxID=196821 RepID=UPI00178500F3|nr:DUF3313 domain-containing protein [Pseudomonas sp. PDM18]MBD9678073.1 DUF3313 domain-containing protein [Pseudomonas sp. PDM18]
MKSYVALLSLLLLPLLQGCAEKQVQPEEYSGFLYDYSRLTEQENAAGTKVLAWIDPKLNLMNYRSIVIERSQFYPAPKATEQLSQATMTQITDYYDKALRRELGQVLKVVDKPGPGTLVLRPAITAVSSHTQSLKPYEVIPIALIAAGVSTAAGIRDQDTQIGTEAAILDGPSSRVVAQVVRKGTGHALENDSQAMAASDFKGVLDGWARDMRLTYSKLRELK